MKYGKKTLAVVCAAAFAIAPLAFVGCGGSATTPTVKGEQVTEEQWSEAIDNARTANNYTMAYVERSILNEGEGGGIRQWRAVYHMDIENGLGHYYTDNEPFTMDGGIGIVLKSANVYCILEFEPDTNVVDKAYKVRVLDDGGIDVQCRSEQNNMTPRACMESIVYSYIPSEHPLAFDLEYSKFTFQDINNYYQYEYEYGELTIGVAVTIRSGYVRSIKEERSQKGRIVEYNYNFSDFDSTKITVPQKVTQAIDDYNAEKE